jgi:hypothetical protein
MGTALAIVMPLFIAASIVGACRMEHVPSAKR